MISLELLEELSRARPGRRVAVSGQSTVEADGVSFAMLEIEAERKLGISGPDGAAAGFEVEQEHRAGSLVLSLCPLSHANAERLRRIFAHTAPSPLARKAGSAGAPGITFGVGDRLGVAGPGHIRAFRRFAASPVLAQQSVRELTLTSRTFEDVLDASTWAAFQEGLREPWGADADHLKTEDWVRKALSTGYTMITADVSDAIRGEHADRPASEVRSAYARLDPAYRAEVEKRYVGRSFPLESGKAVRFAEVVFKKTVLVYREAIELAARLYGAAAETVAEAGFDFELSIDETATATTPQAHLFVALEATRRGVALASLAPRFPGEFQKAIDYIGTVEDFRASFATHAAIARSLGHRISIHSGSDKFSVFPSMGELARGAFHIKTAGTSWLEALRVIAKADPGLFRELYARALERYGEARKLYNVTPDLSALPQPAELSQENGVKLLDDVHARQLLHITYGEMLCVPRLRESFFRVLGSSLPAYWASLDAQIGRHLSLLGAPERHA